jgi:ABC-type cobalamin transport system permease subunit
MFFAGLKLLSILLVLVGPTLLAGRKFGMASAFGALGVTLILSGVAGLMSPASYILYVKVGLGLSLLAWAAWILFAPDHWLSFMQRLMGSSPGSH